MSARPEERALPRPGELRPYLAAFFTRPAESPEPLRPPRPRHGILAELAERGRLG